MLPGDCLLTSRGSICETPLLRTIAELETPAAALERFLPFYWGQIDRASYRFKHPDFAVEQEWRLVKWGDIFDEKHRCSGAVVPYIELDLHDSAGTRPLPLTAVRIGPTPLPERDQYALHRLLLRHGHPPEQCARRASDTPARL